MLGQNSHMFLAVRYNIDGYEEQPVWYLDSPLGKNSITQFLPDTKKVLAAENVLTSNAKGRSRIIMRENIYVVQTLLDKTLIHLQVNQLTGHKRLATLSAYYVPSKEQQETISNILSNAQTAPTAPVQTAAHTTNSSTPTAVQNNYRDIVTSQE